MTGVTGYIFGPIVKNIFNLVIFGTSWNYQLFLKTTYFYDTSMIYYCLNYFIQSVDCTIGAVYNVRSSYLSVCQSVSLSVCQSVSLSVCQSYMSENSLLLTQFSNFPGNCRHNLFRPVHEHLCALENSQNIH
jgi:hypothetical protein